MLDGPRYFDRVEVKRGNVDVCAAVRELRTSLSCGGCPLIEADDFSVATDNSELQPMYLKCG